MHFIENENDDNDNDDLFADTVHAQAHTYIQTLTHLYSTIWRNWDILPSKNEMETENGTLTQFTFYFVGFRSVQRALKLNVYCVCRQNGRERNEINYFTKRANE